MFSWIVNFQVTWHCVVCRMQSRYFKRIDQVDSGPLDHHQDTCANRGISRIRLSQFNHIIGETKRDTWLHRTVAINCEFDASWGDMWTHRDDSIEIGRAKNREIMESWPIAIVQSRPSIRLLRIKQPTIFALNSRININVLPLYLNS